MGVQPPPAREKGFGLGRRASRLRFARRSGEDCDTVTFRDSAIRYLREKARGVSRLEVGEPRALGVHIRASFGASRGFLFLFLSFFMGFPAREKIPCGRLAIKASWCSLGGSHHRTLLGQCVDTKRWGSHFLARRKAGISAEVRGKDGWGLELLSQMTHALEP